MDAVKERGVVFTPPEVAKYMVQLMDSFPGQDVLEPSCGEGYILRYIPENNRITGVDINPAFVRKARKLYPHVTIVQKDFIKFKPSQLYDCIIGNPPYVKIQNLSDDTMAQIRKEYPDMIQGNTNLYIYFLLKCMDLLKENGKLIFLIPNTLFYNKSLEPVLRKLIDGKHIRQVIDFRDEQMFDGFSTYTCIVYLTKQPNPLPHYLYRNGMHGKDRKILFKHPNRTGDAKVPFRARIGLMTLLDDVFILRDWKYSKDRKTITFQQNGTTHTIETGACKKIMKVSKNEKYMIVYPYLVSKGTVVIDDGFEKRFPRAFDYLQTRRNELNQRDAGDVSSYPAWYAYGRTQSLLPDRKKRLFLSSIVKGGVPIDKQVIVASVDLYYAGLWLEPLDPSTTIEQMVDWLHKNNNSILQHSNIKSGGWYSLSQKSFEV